MRFRSCHLPHPLLIVSIVSLLVSQSVNAQTAAVTCADGPPTLSGEALKDELERTERNRRLEMERLERIKAEIVEARALLVAEIVRLEEAIAEAARMEEQQRMLETQVPTDPIELKKYREKIAADRVKLAKAIKSMPPNDAATLLNTLSQPLAADLLARIRPAEAGLILASMKPKDAAALTVIVAGAQNQKKKSGGREGTKKSKKPNKQKETR